MSMSLMTHFPPQAEFGINSLQRFRRACLDGITADAENAIFYRLIADYAGRLLDIYDGLPLPAWLADEGHQNLARMVSAAIDAQGRSPEEQIRALKLIASVQPI